MTETETGSETETDASTASGDATDSYDAVVYDLDGTLVRLAVDWDAVERSVRSVLRDAGVDPTGMTTWKALDAAEDAGVADAVDERIAAAERDGAADAERLSLADGLADDEVPVGVCSLNCEAACRDALERHGLAEHVDVVVGRDTATARKPDPESLLAAVRELGVDPDRTLFVGDSRSDERTAERAGTQFRYVDGGPSDH